MPDSFPTLIEGVQNGRESAVVLAAFDRVAKELAAVREATSKHSADIAALQAATAKPAK